MTSTKVREGRPVNRGALVFLLLLLLFGSEAPMAVSSPEAPEQEGEGEDEEEHSTGGWHRNQDWIGVEGRRAAQLIVAESVQCSVAHC